MILYECGEDGDLAFVESLRVKRSSESTLLAVTWRECQESTRHLISQQWSIDPQPIAADTENPRLTGHCSTLRGEENLSHPPCLHPGGTSQAEQYALHLPLPSA